jgi:hypothetical protein
VVYKEGVYIERGIEGMAGSYAGDSVCCLHRRYYVSRKEGVYDDDGNYSIISGVCAMDQRPATLAVYQVTAYKKGLVPKVGVEPT